MTRHEWLWVVSKGFGLFFLASGIISTMAMFSVIDGGGVGRMLVAVLGPLGVGAYLTFGGEALLGAMALTMPADEPSEEPTDESEEASDAEAQQRRRQAARIRRRRRQRR